LIRKSLLIWVIWIILTGLSFSQVVYEENFSKDELNFYKKDNFDYIELTDCDNIEEQGKPRLPFKIVNLLLPENVELDTIVCEVETQVLPGNFIIYPAQRKQKTDGELTDDLFELDSSIYLSNNYYPKNQFNIINHGYMHGNSILSLALYPLRYLPDSHSLILYNKIKLTIFLKPGSGLYSKTDYTDNYGFCDVFLSNFLSNPEKLSRDVGKYKTTISDQPLYLIITSEELRSSFYPLLEWKTRKGLNASIVTIDSIVNSYNGIDVQERIRNFLVQAYSQSVLWVLIGGDGEILPFRYVYHSNISSAVPLANQQICDLYYADLDGEWDKDLDGVYGEPTDDSPDIYPELFVGRAPVKSREEAEILVRKIINYEKNPGSGDYSFIKKALWISSDQLRDWETVGQHTLVSREVAPSFYQDLQTLVESPTGNAENPTSPTGSKCIETMNQGWGIIGVLAHGKSNGFVASSNFLNEWPKTYVYSDSGNEDGNGHLNNLNDSSNLGLLYSISCNQTALDVEIEPALGTPPCIGKRFLTIKDKGTVAFLGYSRWGWVSSSYKLASAFMKSLFNSEYGYHIGVAEALSKTTYPQYRDLNYGHNLLGDPEMQIWTEIPAPIAINSPSEKILNDSVMYIEATSNQMPLAEAKITLSYKDTLFFLGFSDMEGKLSIPLYNIRPGEFNLTVTKPNFLPYEEIFKLNSTSFVTEKEEKPALNFTLGQNYPNPFNPFTTIPFCINSSQLSVNRLIPTTLIIYNILGQRVKTLVDEEMQSGPHQVIWDGKNENGNEVSSGIYFYQLKAGYYKETKKLTLVR